MSERPSIADGLNCWDCGQAGAHPGNPQEPALCDACREDMMKVYREVYPNGYKIDIAVDSGPATEAETEVTDWVWR